MRNRTGALGWLWLGLLPWLAAASDVRGADVSLDWKARVIELDYRPKTPPPYEPPVITSLSLARDGALLASAGDDHFVRLWDRETGRLVGTLAGHTDWVRCAQFLPDGQTLVSAGNDRRILLWQVRDASAPSRELAMHDEAIAVLAVSPDGSRLAAAGFEKEVRIYEIASGKCLQTLAAPCSDMRALAFSPNGRMLAGAGRCGQIRLWDATSGEERRTLTAHRGRIRGLAFSSDMEQIVSVSEDRWVRVWNVRNGQLATELDSTPAKVLSVQFIGQDRLATAGSDNLVRVWDVKSKQQIGVLRGHTGSVATLESRGGVLVSAGYDTTVRVWQVGDDSSARQAQPSDPPTTTVR